MKAPKCKSNVRTASLFFMHDLADKCGGPYTVIYSQNELHTLPKAQLWLGTKAFVIFKPFSWNDLHEDLEPLEQVPLFLSVTLKP